MKKFVAFVSLVSAFMSASAQFTLNVYRTDNTDLKKSEVIHYEPGEFLEWTDFQGSPDRGGNIAAITTSGFGYKADMQNKGGVGQLNIGIYCYFSKPQSWVKSGRTTDYILEHEQHHFDVSYMASELFVQRIRTAGLTAKNANTLIPKIYRECTEWMNELQNKYDGETANGTKVAVQERWNDFFNEKLGNARADVKDSR